MKNKIALGLVALVAGSFLAISSAEARDRFPDRDNGYQMNRGCGVHQSFNRFRGPRFQQARYNQNQRISSRFNNRRFDNRWFANNPNRRYW